MMENSKTLSGNLNSVIKHIDFLAADLATKYCTVSFGEKQKKQVKLSDIYSSNFIEELRKEEVRRGTKVGLFDDLFYDDVKKQNRVYVSDLQQHRNILIVGAGATYDSYKCIPTGQQVLKRFEEKYGGAIEAFPAVKERYDSYLKELQLQGRKPDFENILAMYSELLLTPRELRDEISELFSFRYCPSLFYEIIAHLFKHSFIDVIINFNFDEILDQAIEEELGLGNYHHIISDGDCVPINNLMVDGRLKIPIYIKPHGTVSHKSTLRFTKRHYLDIPEQIKCLITDLIMGKRGEVRGASPDNIAQINLISVGFNMESLEFSDILNEHLPKKSKIYHFCYENEGDDERCVGGFVRNVIKKFHDRAYNYHIKDRNKPWNYSDFEAHIYKRIPVKQFNLAGIKNELTTPFSEIFSYLWRRTYYSFSKDLLPRSIARHEIVNYFFYQPNYSKPISKENVSQTRSELKKVYQEGTEYFLDRTIVEIAIAINRNNGIVEITQLLGDRVGFYYKKYRDHFYQLKKTNKSALSIYDLLNQFNGFNRRENSEATYFRNVFQLDLSVYEKLKEDEILIALNKDKLDDDISITEGKVKSSMNRWESKNLLRSKEGKLEVGHGLEILRTILKEFSSMIFDNSSQNNQVPIVVLYRLFLAKYFSETFLDNFKDNFKKIVYNGKCYPETLEPERSNILVKEIARLFLKSSRQHYYSIRPRYHDPKNYISESFSKTRLLHTILSVDYQIQTMFFNTGWDIILMISETGSMLNFLKDKTTDKTFEHKKIITLCSYEAIRQLHLNSYPLSRSSLDTEAQVQLVNELHNTQIIDSLGKGVKINKDVFYTFSLPSVRHNHHMILFLKRLSEKDDTYLHDTPFYRFNKDNKSIIFKMEAAMYIYRQGFSNHLNPLFIGMSPYNNIEDIPTLTHDFKKLLRIFTTMFCRALDFEGTKSIKKLPLDLDQLNLQLSNQEDNIQSFLNYLYITNGKLFIKTK